MKKLAIKISLALLLISGYCMSQEVHISGANVYITNDAAILIKDLNLTVNEHEGTAGEIHSAGKININKDITINTLTNPFFELSGQKGLLVFEGSGNSNFNGGVLVGLQNLTIDKTSGALYLNTPVSISGTLSLNRGIIHNNAANVLTIEKNASATAAKSNSHVRGYMAKVADLADDNFIFPLGTGNYARPIGFYDLDGPAVINARHVENNPAGGWNTEPPLEGNIVDGKEMHRITNIEYWELNPNENVSARIVLSWDNMYSQVANHEFLMGAVWNSGISAWRNLGVNSFDIANKLFDSYADTDMFGVFTLGSSQLPPLLGDINEDGFVNVLDVIILVNIINGFPPPFYNEENADVNQDGVINIQDLTALIDLIMGGAKYPDNIISDPGHLYLHEDGNVSFISDGTLLALQFELTGVNMNWAELELNLKTNHKLSFNKENGVGTIYSMNNTPIPGGHIDLMNINEIDVMNLDWGIAIASNMSHKLVDIYTYTPDEETSIADIISDTFNMTTYPNPNTGAFSTEFTLPRSAFLTFEIIDDNGRLVYSGSRNQYERGLHAFNMNLSSVLNSGMYYIRVLEFNTENNKSEILQEQKIVIVK